MQQVIKTNNTTIKTLYDFRFDMYSINRKKRIMKLQDKGNAYHKENKPIVNNIHKIINNRSMHKTPTVKDGYKKHLNNKDWDKSIENRLPKNNLS